MLSLNDDMASEGCSLQGGDDNISSRSTRLDVMKQLGGLFVSALTQEGNARRSAWEQLLIFLEKMLSKEQLKELSKLPETQHYIHRAVKHALKHSDHLGDIRVVERLSILFPGTVEHAKKKELPFSYSYSDILIPSVQRARFKHKRTATTNSVDTSLLHTYSPPTLPATFRGPPVQLNQLLPAATNVSSEFSQVEKNIAHTFPMVIQTTKTNKDLPAPARSQRTHYKSRSTPGIVFEEPKPLLIPMLQSKVQDEHFARSTADTLFPKKQIRSPRKSVEAEAALGLSMKNMYDIINAFGTGELKSESESIYLNYTNSNKWNPYDLTVVSKTKVDPEHFVISKFGILRVYPDQTSDFQSFADWLREAGLYKLLRKISFLKNYLIQRAFRQWYNNARFIRFSQVHSQVSKLSIRFLPDFASALLKIKSLGDELLTVAFYQLSPLSNYNQDSLEHALQISQSNVQRFLLKYFKYCRRIVAEVIKSTHNCVADFEMDKQHKPFVSNLPLSVQKEKQSELERDLKAAKYQESKLTNFVCLAEQVSLTCLLTLFKQEAQSWLATVLRKDEVDSVHVSLGQNSIASSVWSHNTDSTIESESKQSPSGRSTPDTNTLLSGSFEFSVTGELCTGPSASDLETLIVEPLQQICLILSTVAGPFTKPITNYTQKSINEQPPTTKNTSPISKDSKRAPPSMAPSRQPKSLLTVLKGLSAPEEGSDVISPSERARSQLSEVIAKLSERNGSEGTGLSIQKSPLDSEKFTNLIKTDKVFLDCMVTIKGAVEQVAAELKDLCSQYSWLNSVHLFIDQWEGKQKVATMSASEYEMVLSQLYNWIELLEQLPPKFVSSHSLLSVSPRPVLERMKPQLAAILEQLTSVGIERAMVLCSKVLEDTKQQVEVLSAKRYDLEGFAEYANQLRACQAFNKSKADNISYVLQVHSALLRHGVNIPKDDKALSMKLQQVWQEFRDKLKEAEAFVRAQTPMKAQGLQESIEACVEELSALVSKVNEGEFINPATAVPSKLLEKLEVIHEEALAVWARLLGLSKWKEAITGESHNLSVVNNLMNQQYARQELWKYRRVFDNYEREWTKMPFKKLDINFLSHKVSDWLTACAKLEQTLPLNDPVLTAWRDRLQQLEKRIPLLQQLSSKALKVSNWCTIFASLGEEYNPDCTYTLVDFDLYKIYDHSDIIFEICHDAMQQEKLQAKVDQLQTLLNQKVIIINQFPIERYPFAMPSKSEERLLIQHTYKASHTLSTTKSTGPGSPSKATLTVGFQGLKNDSIAMDYLFTIESHCQLCAWLEDTLIQIKVILSSPHLGSLKVRGEQLLKTLTEVQEIVTLLSQCQNKWWELLSLFSQMEQEQQIQSGLKELQQAGSKYQEIVVSIRDDPRLLSLLSKRRGQKGFRDLQGEQLRQRAHEVDSVLETVVHKVKAWLKDSCIQFPRLCYLSDKEILRLLSNTGSPISIIPLISRAFPSIKGMQLTEIASNQSSTSLRKLASNIEEGFQVLMMEGWCGEQVPLSSPLPLGRRSAPQWLKALEGALSHSVAANLTDCLGSLPDCLMGGVTSVTSDAAVIRWLSGNLSQCVQLALNINWTSAVHSALLSDDPTAELKQLRLKLSNTIELVTDLIRSFGKEIGRGASKRLWFATLQNAILILSHKSSTVKALIDSEKTVAVNCFTWRHQILYSTEIESLYRDHSKKFQEQNSFISSLPKLTGKALLGYKLQGSSHSLVASSKSLLSSRNNLQMPSKPGSDLIKSGTSSIVLTNEVSSSKCLAPTKCMVHCGESITSYAFEYLSPDTRLVLTPHTEACILSVLNSIARFNSCSLHGGSVSGKTETAQEIAKVVGRHCYVFQCSPEATLTSVQRLLTGAIQTGSLFVLDNFVDLQLEIIIILGEWLKLLSMLFTKAFKGKLLSEEETQSEAGLTNVGNISTPLQHSLGEPPSYHSTHNLPAQSSTGIAATSSVKITREETPSQPHLFHRGETLSQLSFAHQSSVSGRTSRTTTRVDWYKMVEEEVDWFGYGGVPKEELEFNGDLLKVSPAFGCVLITPESLQTNSDIPQQLKAALRSVSVTSPDLSWITEVLLVSNGFKSAHKLGRNLSTFWQHFSDQISSNNLDVSPPPSITNLPALKLIINHASTVLHNPINPQGSEKDILANSIKQFLSPQMTHPRELEQREEIGHTVNSSYKLAAWNKLNNLLDLHFPGSISHGEEDECELSELTNAVKSQLKDQHLQTLPSLISKIQQLHLSLKSSKCVVLSGPSGSGKSTCYSMLASAYQYIRELRALGKSSKAARAHHHSDQTKSEEYPTLDITVINPAAYSFDELFGSYNESSDLCYWRDGILTRILCRMLSIDQPTSAGQEALDSGSVVHWIVLDGFVDRKLTEVLASLVSGEGLFLSNGDKLTLPKSCQILVETTSLTQLTPSLLAHSALLYFSDSVLTYDAVINTWLDRAPTQHNLSAMSTETLATAIKDLLPETIDFLHKINTKCLGTSYSVWPSSQIYGLTETQCFLRFLSAVLERNSPKAESSVTYTGLASRSSRLSSRIESRASSTMLSTTYSSASMQVEHSNISISPSKASLNNPGEPLEPLPDDLSECNIEAEISFSLQFQMASILTFTYIWSLGAFCPFSEVSSFSDFAREMIGQCIPFDVSLPEEGSVFDYYLNMKQYKFLPWAERKSGTSGNVSNTGYVSLPELERYTYIIDLYLSYGLNVMIIGQRGSGKSSLVENLLQSRLPITRLQITPALTPYQMQDKILSQLGIIEKRAGQRFSQRHSTSKCIFYLDDIHLAHRTTTWSMTKRSTLLELVRFTTTHHQLHDYSRNYLHTLNEAKFISSCTPDEYWRLPVEFSRAFNPVPFLPPSNECLRQIFSRNVLLWLQEFPETSIGDPETFAEALGTASVAVIRSLVGRVHPSPSSPHLTFSLHDFMHVYEGLLLLSPDAKAQTQLQFNILNRRGFLSSSQSGRLQKKSKQKKNTLPSLNVGPTQSKARRSRSHSVALLSSDQAQSTIRTVIRLWCHETTRVYLDRIVNSKDRIWFTKLLEVCIKYCFCGDDLTGSAKKSISQQQNPLGTASYGRGGRRVRGGGMRGTPLAQSLSHDGPSLEELAKTGVKVEVLQQLMPSGEDGSGLTKLIQLDQVTMRGEDLTGLIFAQFPKAINSSEEKGDSNSASELSSDGLNYSELGDGQVMDILKDHIKELKCIENEADVLVLFKGAIEHASRICRAMSLIGSHSILIGARGSGRRTLVRLLSQVFKAKLFEMSSGLNERRVGEVLQATLKNVCVSAAMDSQPTVLLVNSTDKLGVQEWEKIRLLMENGLCPGLFTTSELLVMSSKLQKGRVKKTTDGARQVFSKAVWKHLHVFIIWDIDSRTECLFNSSTGCRNEPGDQTKEEYLHEEQMRAIFLSLCRASSYIDHVVSWSKQEYTDIALRWWQQSNDTGGVGVKWEDWIGSSSQLEAVGTLATHIHLTTSELLARIYGPQSSILLSPKVFIEALRIAQELAIKFKAEEEREESHLKVALQKLSDVDHRVYELERELSILRPELAMAEHEVHQRMSQITTAKEKYMAANQRCKTAENTIKSETKNVEHYSKMVEDKFSEVSSVYYSALNALSSVRKNDILELMSYRNPPEMIQPVFDALCMLFDREQTWDDCKQLLLSPNFFENLRFFDKDNVPKRKLQQLEKMIIKHSKFEAFGVGSFAVVSLCSWLNALIDYHHAKMAVQPFREKLAEAERTLLEANKTYIEMRRDMIETKTELEETVKVHKESVQKQRVVESKIEGFSSKLDHANHLLSTMSKQRHKWEEKIKATRGRIDSLPGHAVLCSASVCYLTRVPADNHSDLLSSWLGYCNGSITLGHLFEDLGGIQSAQGHQVYSGQQQVVRIQKDFKVAAHLSEEAERSHWEQESVFPDQTMLERCLSTRLYCKAGKLSWPLVFDPYGHFKDYLIALEGNTSNLECGMIVQCDIRDSQITQELLNAMTNGFTVLIHINNANSLLDEDYDISFISRVFRKAYFKHDNQTFLDSSCNVLVHPNFKFFIVIEQNLESLLHTGAYSDSLVMLCGEDLSSSFVVELGLSPKALQSHTQKLILKYKKPEFGIRYKSLLTDLALHRQQLKNNERAILNCGLVTATSLLEVPDLITIVQQSESSDAATQELILETNKNIRAFDQQSLAYVSLSKYSSLLYKCIHRLEQCFHYFKFPLAMFEELFSEVLSSSSRGVRVPDNLMAINAHVLHLRHQLLSVICRAFKSQLFKRHQILLLLLVGLETMKHQGKLTSDELNMLGRALSTTENQIELASSNLPSISSHEPTKPQWINDKSWCAILQLQKSLPSFRRLSTEICNHSNEWMEYCKSTPSLLMPVPGYGESCSMAQKLLLWKTLQPEMFPEAVKDFILLTLGADFTDTQHCTITSILPHTSPMAPALCYFDKTNNFADCLKQAAREVNREVTCVGLMDESHLLTLQTQFTNLMQNGHWVMIENFQLCPKPAEMISSLKRVLFKLSDEVNVHPEFRVWLPLPLSFFIRNDLGKGFAFDGLSDKVSAYASWSDRFLNDLQVVIDHTFMKERISRADTHKWEMHFSLIVKLQNFISQPMSVFELIKLDPNQDTSQSVVQLIFEELTSANKVLALLHSSLQQLCDFFTGNLPFTAQYGATLKSLSDNILPENWLGSLSSTNGFPTKLISALELLKERFLFYQNILQSGTIPTELSLHSISKPLDLISRSLLLYATKHQVHPSDVSIHAQAIKVGETLLQETELCFVFKHLTLHGVKLDSQGQLTPVTQETCTSTTEQPCWVVVWFERRESINPLFTNCPVFINSVSRFSLPLTNSQCDFTSSVSSGIYLSCDSTTLM